VLELFGTVFGVKVIPHTATSEVLEAIGLGVVVSFIYIAAGEFVRFLYDSLGLALDWLEGELD
jgi:hypothetical protein